MRRLLPVILFAITAGPVLADTPVTGKWICDYGVRNLSSAAQTSSNEAVKSSVPVSA